MFDSFEEHIRLMFDMLTLAFQTDSTRVSTFIIGHEGCNRPYPFIGVNDGHHDISHHFGNRGEHREDHADQRRSTRSSSPTSSTS